MIPGRGCADRGETKMKTKMLAMAITGTLMFGAAHAKDATFNSVPANVADAPVTEWRSVERLDKDYRFIWKLVIPNGAVWIQELHKGRYWAEWRFSSEKTVLKDFRSRGWKNIHNVESIAYAGSQWGYMAIANWKNGQECVLGKVLDNDNHSHDGGDGGTLQGYAADCGPGAAGRFGAWKIWFRSFKRVPLSYNIGLDK